MVGSCLVFTQLVGGTLCSNVSICTASSLDHLYGNRFVGMRGFPFVSVFLLRQASQLGLCNPLIYWRIKRLRTSCWQLLAGFEDPAQTRRFNTVATPMPGLMTRRNRVVPRRRIGWLSGGGSLTKATIRPPWAISAPKGDFTRSAFTASMAALVSCRKVSMPASTLAMSALVTRLALSRATRSSASVGPIPGSPPDDTILAGHGHVAGCVNNS